MLYKTGIILLMASMVTSCDPHSAMSFLQMVEDYADEAKVNDKAKGEITRSGSIVYEGDENSPIFGASLSVPENAVDENETVQVEIIYQPDMELPGEPDAQIILYKPKDYTFDKPVAIGLPYGHLSSVDTDDLVIVRFNPETNEKQSLPTTDVSQNTKIVYTETKTLGYFAVSQQGIEVLEFTDGRDNQPYKKVVIGEQVWMAQNLNYASSSSKFYNNESFYEANYGRLYTQKDAMEVCPEGWHLPSDAEWKELEEFLGMNAEDLDKEWDRGEGVGGMLKETGTNHWMSPNEGAINSVKFSALPGGMAESASSFIELGQTAYFWTSSSISSDEAWYRVLYYADSYLGRLAIIRDRYMSVRCVLD